MIPLEKKEWFWSPLKSVGRTITRNDSIIQLSCFKEQIQWSERSILVLNVVLVVREPLEWPPSGFHRKTIGSILKKFVHDCQLTPSCLPWQTSICVTTQYITMTGVIINGYRHLKKREVKKDLRKSRRRRINMLWDTRMPGSQTTSYFCALLISWLLNYNNDQRDRCIKIEIYVDFHVFLVRREVLDSESLNRVCSVHEDLYCNNNCKEQKKPSSRSHEHSRVYDLKIFKVF